MGDAAGHDRIPGFRYVLPTEVLGKKVDAIEVGPFVLGRKATEINDALGTSIDSLLATSTSVLVHSPSVDGFEGLLEEAPFVDRIIHQAALNEALTERWDAPYTHVVQVMLNPGTSDMDGNIALDQALLKLDGDKVEGDQGFQAMTYFINAPDLSAEQFDDVVDRLSSRALHTTLALTREEYEAGQQVQVPVVTLEQEATVQTYDIVSMSDDELLAMNKERSLAASLEELVLFREMYKDEAFLARRAEVGLTHEATDVEIETWFGLRSEHCFHKTFNARLSVEDFVDDPVFNRAVDKGWLERDTDSGILRLDEGIFKKFIVEPAETIEQKLEARGNNWIVSMFSDNSGVVLYDENFMYCIKFETHNSPSNIEPWQGAKTGLDGVFRDIFGTQLGTFDLLSGFFMYGVGNPDYEGWLPQGVIDPEQLLKRMVGGVREAGNEMQVATLGGKIVTDPRYVAKCLLFAGSVGWSPTKSPDGVSYIGKNAGIDDLIFIVGQAVGIDGIHGATQSSLSAHAGITLGHVQADESFIQAKVRGFLQDVARRSLLTDITDCGAMGISSMHEVAERTGGLIVDYELHPRKFAGIQPWQIGASETQDRMILIASRDQKEELEAAAEMHDVDLTELGHLNDSGFLDIKYGERTVGLIDIERLFDSKPQKELHGVWNPSPEKPLQEIKESYSLEESLSLVLARPDVASPQWFFQQKDSSVGGGTIQTPLVGIEQVVAADATLQKPLDTEGKDHGAIAYALGSAPKISDLDPYIAAQRSFLDMVGQIIAIGGKLPNMEEAKWDAWAVCGNYCQPNSDADTTLTRESGEHNLASLVREAIGVREAIEATNIPVISGKDSVKCSAVYDVDFAAILDIVDPSLAAEYRELPSNVQEDIVQALDVLDRPESFDEIEDIILQAIPPDLRPHVTIYEREKTLTRDDGEEYTINRITLEIHDPDTYLASATVRIEDHRKCVDGRFKQEGDLIYVVGKTHGHLGGTQYAQAIGYAENGAPLEGGKAPHIDLEEFVAVSNAVSNAIDAETVASASYIHDGGLAVALAKGAMSSGRGVDVDTAFVPASKVTLGTEEVLYDEGSGRFLLTVAPGDREAFEKEMSDVSYACVGRVTKSDGLNITRRTSRPEFADVINLQRAYQETFDFENQLEEAA